MPLFINYPAWINPSIFPGVPFLEHLRWYGLMYVFAFGTAYFVFSRQVKEGALTFKDEETAADEIYSFF